MRDLVTEYCGDDEKEAAQNMLYFYEKLDQGEFAGHRNDWVLVYNQKILEYGPMYDDDKLSDVLDEMPSAIQLPVNQENYPRRPPAKKVVVQRTPGATDYKV